MNRVIYIALLLFFIFELEVISIADTIEFEPYTEEEEPYLINKGTHDFAKMVVDFGAAFNANHFRFADGDAYWIYKFDFNKSVMATAIMDLGAEFKVSIAISDLGEDDDYKIVMEEKKHTHGLENKKIYTIKWGDHFKIPTKRLWIKFQDSIREDGWGPYLDKFTLEYTLGQPVEPAGKLALSWGMVKRAN